MLDPKTLIPHRDPFLFIDEILELTETSARAKRSIRPGEPHFAGHYPGKPVMPGVLLCEAVIQTGALIAAKIAASSQTPSGVPVLTRITSAKFRHPAKPGDDVMLFAELTEHVGGGYFFKGWAEVSGKKALTIEFACAIAESI